MMNVFTKTYALSHIFSRLPNTTGSSALETNFNTKKIICVPIGHVFNVDLACDVHGAMIEGAGKPCQMSLTNTGLLRSKSFLHQAAECIT